MKYILFTTENMMAPIAHALKREGEDVVLAQVDDLRLTLTEEEKKSGSKKEDPDKKKKRLGMYDGSSIKKADAVAVLKAMKKLNPKDYFVFSDYNSLFNFTQQAEKMGFTGMLPKEEHRNLEVDRTQAKEIVKKNYPGLKIMENMEFKKVEEGIQFLEESEDIWVLKSLGDSGETVVPKSDDPDLAKSQIISVLKKDSKSYEANGFMLEQKIVDGAEVTPQAVFLDGKLVYTSLDIETKTIASGEKGPNRGCGTNLIIKTSPTDRINQIAFPPYIYDMAKKTKGIFIIDAGIIFDRRTGVPYFTEFCFQRFGWDAFPTEVSMSGGASAYFRSVMKGQNPLKYRFGMGTRLFNLNFGEGGGPQEGLAIKWGEEADKCLYLYDIKVEEDDVVTNGYMDDVGVITGVGKTLREAVDECYEYADAVSMKDIHYRTRDDAVSTSYIQSIMNRLRYAVEKGWMEDGGIIDDINSLTGRSGQEEMYDNVTSTIKTFTHQLNSHYGGMESSLRQKLAQEHEKEIEDIKSAFDKRLIEEKENMRNEKDAEIKQIKRTLRKELLA